MWNSHRMDCEGDSAWAEKKTIKEQIKKLKRSLIIFNRKKLNFLLGPMTCQNISTYIIESLTKYGGL